MPVIQGIRTERIIKIIHEIEEIQRLTVREKAVIWGGVKIPADVNILARDYAGTTKTVTETILALKDSVASIAPKNVIYPLDVVVDATNPLGSAVDLLVELRFRHSDGTENAVDSFSIAEEESVTKDYLTTHLMKALKDGVSIVEVRLCAYCSAAPISGFEPTVKLTKMGAFQF